MGIQLFFFQRQRRKKKEEINTGAQHRVIQGSCKVASCLKAFVCYRRHRQTLAHTEFSRIPIPSAPRIQSVNHLVKKYLFRTKRLLKLYYITRTEKGKLNRNSQQGGIMGVAFSSFKDNYCGSWSIPPPQLPHQGQKRKYIPYGHLQYL